MKLNIVNLSDSFVFVFLLTSFAPIFYLPPVVFLLLILLTIIFAYKYFQNDKLIELSVPKFSLIVLFFLFYLLFSAALSGLNLFDVLNYDAIRYDSNVFYSFLPFFIILKTNLNLEKLDKKMVFITFAGGFFYLFLGFCGVDTFESHNAAGGYFMVLLSFFIARHFNEKTHTLPILFLGYLLIETNSRGSILAVLLSSLALFAKYKKPTLYRFSLLLFLFLIIIVGYYIYINWIENGSILIMDYSSFSKYSLTEQEDNFEREGTFYHRVFYLFPLAIDYFLKSPFLGVGFGRFDDFPSDLFQLIPFVTLNVTSNVMHTNLHSHNSFLNILAETGLFGFTLICVVFKSIFKSFENNGSISNIVYMLILTLLFASLSEHRLTTPSQAAPVFILIMLLFRINKSPVKVSTP